MNQSYFVRIIVLFLIVGLIGIVPLPNGTFIVCASELIPPHHLKIGFGDTLSQALDRQFPERTWRLWGRKGAIARIAALNPKIKDIHQLKPGTVLDIGSVVGEFVAEKSIAVTRSPAEVAITQEPHESLPSQPSVQNSAPVVSAAPIETNRFGWIGLEPRFYFSRLDVVDNATSSEASLISEMNSGFKLTLGQHWTDAFQTSLNFVARNEQYQFLAETSTLEKGSPRLAGFSLRLSFFPIKSRRLSFETSFNFEQRPFVRAKSTNVITIDSIMVQNLEGGARFELAEIWPFTASIYGDYLYFLPAQGSMYKIKAGSGYEFGGSLAMAITQVMQLIGGAYLSGRAQDTSIAKQSAAEVGFTLGLTYRLEPPAAPTKALNGEGK